MDGISFFLATTNGSNPQKCEVNGDETSCTINGLTAYTDYEVSLQACDKSETDPIRMCSTTITNTTKTLPAGKFWKMCFFCISSTECTHRRCGKSQPVKSGWDAFVCFYKRTVRQSPQYFTSLIALLNVCDSQSIEKSF